jgi:L-asparaginase
MDPIRVAVWRGEVVEAVHTVHAVAVAEGLILEQAGDPELVTYLRSSSKPIQAAPLARARPDLDERDLAIASSSHVATAEQIEAVLRLLANAPADAEELECGLQEGRPQQRLYHNCSGKHAGMLALCRANLWVAPGYSQREHAVQQVMLHEHAEVAEVPVDEIPTAIDGCGVLTFALPLERIAHAFSRLESVEGGRRVADAMRAHPELIGSAGGSDVRLMRGLSGWVSKNGAEGLACAAGPGGIGIVLKAEDGAQRPIAAALSVFLGRLGLDGSVLAENPIVNSLGETVGEVRAL